MNRLYHQKYKPCIAAWKQFPEGSVQFSQSSSGLKLFIKLYTPLTEAEVSRRANELRVPITPARQFYHRKTAFKHIELLFEFGSIPVEEIVPIFSQLRAAWFKHE